MCFKKDNFPWRLKKLQEKLKNNILQTTTITIWLSNDVDSKAPAQLLYSKKKLYRQKN